jgi:hypothetical protein
MELRIDPFCYGRAVYKFTQPKFLPGQSLCGFIFRSHTYFNSFNYILHRAISPNISLNKSQFPGMNQNDQKRGFCPLQDTNKVINHFEIRGPKVIEHHPHIHMHEHVYTHLRHTPHTQYRNAQTHTLDLSVFNLVIKVFFTLVRL